MKFGWLFLVVAVIVAIYAHLIDRAAKNNKTLRVILTIICIILLFTTILLIVNSLKVL